MSVHSIVYVLSQYSSRLRIRGIDKAVMTAGGEGDGRQKKSET